MQFLFEVKLVLDYFLAMFDRLLTSNGICLDLHSLLPYTISLLNLIINFLPQFSRHHVDLLGCIFLAFDIMDEYFLVEG